MMWAALQMLECCVIVCLFVCLCGHLFVCFCVIDNLFDLFVSLNNVCLCLFAFLFV